MITGNFPPFAGGKVVALAARVGLQRDKSNKGTKTKRIKNLIDPHLHLPGQNENTETSCLSPILTRIYKQDVYRKQRSLHKSPRLV